MMTSGYLTIGVWTYQALPALYAWTTSIELFILLQPLIVR